jgi:pimeloyl-ACP methyl ester carboxylesterase
MAATPARAQQGDADYAGWVFFDNGSDMPLQAHLRGEAALLSFPTGRAFGVAAQRAALPDGRIEFALEGEPRLTVTGSFEGGAFRGRFERGPELRGRVELFASARPLATQSRDGPASGVFCGLGEAAFVLSAWAWGEPRLLDIASGADRTLFALSAGGWMAGGALYTPSREESVFVFEDGAAMRSANGATTRYERVALRDEIVRFDSAGVTLEGTLTLPPGAGPFAVAIILGGSDVTVRGDVRRTVEIFAAMGVAAFAFDLRGYGASGGARANLIATGGADACAAAMALRARPDIRAVGLYGSSRGGWVAPSAAAQCDVDFMILVAAPAVSPRAQLTRYRLDAFARQHASAAERRAARAYVEATWRAFEGDAAWARYQGLRAEARERGWLGLLQGPETRESDDYQWLALNRDYDPLPALRGVRAPTLALYGARDAVVDPAVNAPLLRRNLRQAAPEVVTIADADHGLYLVDPENPYAPLPVHLALGYAPATWPTIRGYLRRLDVLAR